jgi:hypothetical protein
MKFLQALFQFYLYLLIEIKNMLTLFHNKLNAGIVNDNIETEIVFNRRPYF